MSRRGMKFSEMIDNAEGYKFIKGVEGNISMFIDHRTNWHWFLLVKLTMDGTQLPFVLLEVCVNDNGGIEREMFTLEKYDGELTYCGEFKGKINDVVKVADEIVLKMGDYSLFSSNCQHFCNNVLNYYNFKVYRTTLGKEITATIKKQVSTTAEEEEALEELTRYEEEVELDDPIPPLTNRRTALEKRLRSVYAASLNKLVGAS